MSKHTPGPWIVNDTYDGTFIRQPIEDGIIAEVISYVLKSKRGNETIANANIIAAAPDMYDALILAEGIINSGEYSTGFERETMEAIRYALDKAEGRDA